MADDGGDTQADVFDATVAVNQPGYGQNTAFVAEDSPDDFFQGQAYAVTSGALGFDDVIGRLADLIDNGLAVLIGAIMRANLLAVGEIYAAQVGNDVTYNTTWIPQGNPWIITNSISILDGGTLNLKPGVIIKIDGPYSIQTFGRGRIVAEGLSSNWIHIRSNNPLSYNYSFISTGVGGVIRNCSFSNGDTDLIAKNDTIIEDSWFTESQTGIRVKGNDVEINGCVFDRCEVGIHVVDSSRTSVVDSDISSGIRGIHLVGTTNDTLVDDCRISYTEIRGIEIEVSGLGNRISNCEMRTAGVGVLVWNSKDVLLHSVSIISSRVGIGINDSSVSSSEPIVVQRCRMVGNIVGIKLSSARYTIITESTLEDNQVGVDHSAAIGTEVEFWSNNFLWGYRGQLSYRW